MKNICLFIITLFTIACSNKPQDLIVTGQVKGLKKGTIYLKRVQDSVLVTVDSLIINGASNFELKSDLQSPEIFYLYLDKHSNENDGITFFADKGTTEINTTLKNFAYDAKINGSKQQKVLEEYRAVISRINNKNLDLIKEKFEALKNKDTAKLKDIEKQSQGNLRRKYLFTVNFALNNKDSEVAPYLALSEIYNARIDLLDTINVSLTPKVKESKYGIELQSFIDKAKASE